MEIDWRPGIGDPTAWGWGTLAAYVAACLLSARAAHLSQFSPKQWQGERLFWACVAAITLALGINKQLDLQSLLTEIARAVAKENGWYSRRRGVQEIAIGLFAAFGIGTMVVTTIASRKFSNEIKVAAGGLCLLTTFLIIRAASFHNIDVMLSKTVIIMKWNVFLELAGILIVAGAACRYARNISRRLNRLRPDMLP